jgi:ketol-acid reductoisomerase
MGVPISHVGLLGTIDLARCSAATGETAFELTPAGSMEIKEQEYFDNAVLMVAMCKAGNDGVI